MAFSKDMPAAFRVTLFNGSRDNDEVKSHAYLHAEQELPQYLHSNIVMFYCLTWVLTKACILRSIMQICNLQSLK